MTDPVRISVIIPTRNRKDLLRHAVEGVWNQTVPHEQYELIVVDNCSTDGTAEMMVDLENISPCRLRYIVMPDNRGPAQSRNTAARQASGEILAFIDDDCCPTPKWLEHGIQPFEDSSVAFVNGTVAYFPDQVPKAGLFTRYGHEVKEESPLYTWSNMLFRRTTFWEMGGSDESLCEADFLGRVVDCGDTDLAWRTKKAGHANRFVREAVVHHVLERMRPTNWVLEPLRLFNVALLASRHPEIRRRLFVARLFFSDSNLYFYLALAGVLLALTISVWWLVLVLPELLWALRLLRPGWSLIRWIKVPAQMAFLAMRQFMFAVALVYGSVRYRSVVL